ncbi:MAG: hypothetical protein O3A20_07075 [Planctomycetota bacterium]|nr:hypothetical protein [Planctomycetota bacterium]
MKSSKQADAILAEFCWSAWAEFGVSAWTRKHQDWCIDPEALLILTGCLSATDLRLRGEVLDWCATNEALLSRARTRTLLRSWPSAEAWPAFAADLTAATGKSWEGAAGGSRFQATGKSALTLEDRPAAIALRIRAVLGVGARSEIVRTLLLAPEARSWSKQELSVEVAYTRRNVHDAVDQLHAAGALRTLESGSRARYLLDRRPSWLGLFAPLPSRASASASLLRAAWRLRCASEAVHKFDQDLRSIEARRWWSEIEPDLSRAEWQVAQLPTSKSSWSVLQSFQNDFFDQLAAGQWQPAFSA